MDNWFTDMTDLQENLDIPKLCRMDATAVVAVKAAWRHMRQLQDLKGQFISCLLTG